MFLALRPGRSSLFPPKYFRGVACGRNSCMWGIYARAQAGASPPANGLELRLELI